MVKSGDEPSETEADLHAGLVGEMREEVRLWARLAAHEVQTKTDGLRLAAHQAHRGVLTVGRFTPAVLLAGLSASALTPVALAATAAVPGGAAMAATAAGLTALAGVGTNILSELIMRGTDSWRGRGTGETPPTAGTVREELAERIERALDVGGTQAAELRREIAAVLLGINALGTLVEEMDERQNDRFTLLVTQVFSGLSDEFAELNKLVRGVDQTLVRLERIVLRQNAEYRSHQEALNQLQVQIVRLREPLPDTARSPGGEADPTGATPATPWTGDGPYRGLRPFQQGDAEVFHGREQLIGELLAELSGRLDRPGMLMVTGASGAGKTSLLRAGLLPRLARGLLPGKPDSEHWPQLVITPNGAPLTELSVHLAALAGTTSLTAEEALAGAPDQAHRLFRQAALRHAERHGRPAAADTPGRVVLVVDQFEEIFTLAPSGPGPDGHVETFLSVLRAAAETPAGPGGQPAALIVLGMRGDFSDRCADYEILCEVLRTGLFRVWPMGEPELRQAIVGPAHRAGLTLDEGFVDVVLGDLRSQQGVGRDSRVGVGALPLLSQAMLATWNNREGNRLTLRGYGAGGGVTHAVQASADAAYESLDRTRREITRRLFQRMTVVLADGQYARRPLALSELRGDTSTGESADVDTVLEAFTTRRLIVLHEDVAEISHDVLLQAWPRLHEWLRHDQDARIQIGQLNGDAEDWRLKQRSHSLLYSGSRVEDIRQARTGWEADPDRYPPVEAIADEFLAASARAAGVAARATRRRTIAIGVLSVFLAAALAVVLISYIDTEANRREALSRLTMVQSDRAGDTDALVSGLLAATAWNLFPTAEARYGMVDALATSVRSVFPTHGKESDAAAFSPDGKILATAGTGNAVHLWDTATRRRIGRPLTGHTHPIREMRFSPDGKTFATVSQDHSVRLWDTVNRRPVGAPIIPNPTVTDPDGRILTIAFSPDGRAIAVETVDSAIGFWEVSTGRRIDASTAGRPEAFREVPSGFGKAAAPPHSDTVRLWDTTRRQITALAAIEGGAPGLSAFSPDGRTIATVRDNAKEDDTVRLWDAVTRRRIGAPIAVGSGRVHTLAFSPDGRTLAVSGRDKAVRLWDTATGRRVGVTLTGHTDSVTTMNFIRGGRTLATTSGDGTARLWDLTAYRQIGRPLVERAQAPLGVMFSPDGKTLATTGDGAVRLWDTGTRRQVGAPMTGLGEAMYAVAFGSGGKTLVTVEGDVLRIWDTATRHPHGAPLFELSGTPGKVALSPDERILATAQDNTIQLWDAGTRRPLTAPITAHGADGVSADAPDGTMIIPSDDGINAVVFSPDGRILATAGNDGVTRLWDTATGRQAGPSLDDESDSSYAVAFSPDGKILATSGVDPTAGDAGVVRLWTVATGRPFGTPLLGHTGGVDAVTFSPDGRTLVTGGDDGTVRLWDVDTRRQIGDPLLGHTASVRDVAFGPGGSTLATTSDDGTVRLWNIPLPSAPSAAICAVAGRSLTEEEWRHYMAGMSDESFRKVCP